MRLWVFFLALNLSFLAIAQEEKWEVDTGRVELNMPVEVKALLERHKGYLEKVKGIPGYRIQIAATATLKDIKEIQKKFDETFFKDKSSILDNEQKDELPDFETYIVYSNPSYRLQVGNYRTRLEAYHDLIVIRKEFSQAFISRGPIDLMTK